MGARGPRHGTRGGGRYRTSNPDRILLVLGMFHRVFHTTAYRWGTDGLPQGPLPPRRLAQWGNTGQKEAPTAGGTVRAMGQVVDWGYVVYIPLRNLQFHCTVGIAIRQ